MKKSRFLAFALVVAVMMMGAGYAYWTQDLTINNTVDTGELDVVFTSPDVATEDQYMGSPQATYCNLVSDDTHALDIYLNDVYPGAQSTITFTLENTGTLGAYVDDFSFIDIDGTTRTVRYANAIENLILCNSLKIDDTSVALSDTDGNGYITLEEALDTLNAETSGKGIFLDPTVKKEIKMTLQIDTRADNDSLPEDSSFSFYIGANVYQYNAK